MLAIKENRAYTISEIDVKKFANEGYDIYDENGKIVAYGAGKVVPFEKYVKLMEQVETLQGYIDKLEDEIAKLKKDSNKKKEK